MKYKIDLAQFDVKQVQVEILAKLITKLKERSGIRELSEQTYKEIAHELSQKFNRNDVTSENVKIIFQRASEM